MQSGVLRALGLGWMLCGVAAASEPATTRPASPTATAATADRPAAPRSDEQFRPLVQRLVSGLSSPRYAVRREAGQRLAQLPDEALDALAEAYRDTRDAEVRRHIRLAASPMVVRRLTAQGQQGDAFLGISFVVHTTVVDGRQRPVVYVSSVLPDTPAQRHGLREGDSILRVNDQSVEEIADPQQVSEKIGSHRPGQTLRLTVLRGVHRLDLEIPLASRLESLPAPERELARFQALQEFWSRLDGPQRQPPREAQKQP